MTRFRPKIACAFALSVGLGLCVWLFDFTVDDALISIRYAHHLAIGQGARFNLDEAPSDGVTPIFWHYILAAVAAGPPLATLKFAKVLGVMAWLSAATALSLRIARQHPKPVAQLASLALFASPNLAAWSVSGMETGLSIAIAISAVLLFQKSKTSFYLACCMAGLLATFRPECLPWAICLCLGAGIIFRKDAKRPWLAAAAGACIAILPFLAVCSYRYFAFGYLAPLSARAKPSDLHHGFVYALASLLVLGLPLACLSPRRWLRASPFAQVLLVSFFVHTATIVAIGGDWMPMSRLFMPVLPSLALVLGELLEQWSLPRLIVAILMCFAGQGFVAYRVGPSSAHVGKTREAWISSLGPYLEKDDVFASVDIGWVGAAYPGKIVDLAGVTDPAIAAFPGGHTSKAIPSALLAERGVTKLLLLMAKDYDGTRAWEEGYFARGVETRIARQVGVRDNFELVGEIGTGPYRYAVLGKRKAGND